MSVPWINPSEYKFISGIISENGGNDEYEHSIRCRNILKAEQAVERLRYNKVNNQVSFYTLLALEPSTILRLIRLYRIPKIRFGRSQQNISQIGSMKSRN